MKDLIPQIGKLFKEATWPVRQAAVISLGKFAEQGVFDEAIRTLVPEMKKLFKDDAWEVRQAVLVTIGELAKKPIFQGKIKDIVPQIGKLLKDTTWPVRYAAVATVDNLTENSIFHGRIKDIAPQFEQLLRDDTWDVRRAAVRTVAKFTKQSMSLPRHLTRLTSTQPYLKRNSNLLWLKFARCLRLTKLKTSERLPTMPSRRLTSFLGTLLRISVPPPSVQPEVNCLTQMQMDRFESWSFVEVPTTKEW
ncbi:armadillo-type protein [Mycena latifolia]|nr:armadillo-type protein [Mycena latifolia]